MHRAMQRSFAPRRGRRWTGAAGAQALVAVLFAVGGCGGSAIDATGVAADPGQQAVSAAAAPTATPAASTGPVDAATRAYPAKGSPTIGAIGPDAPWPLLPIHVAITPDARLMSFGRDASDSATMVYDVWDYTEGLDAAAHLTLPNRTGTDLFCANQMLLPTGELLMTGGDTRVEGTIDTIGWQPGVGNRDANVYDFRTKTVSRRGQMNWPRWYGTMTKLPWGEIYIQGGAITLAADQMVNGVELHPRYAEIASIDGRTYTELSALDVDSLPWYYPRNFVSRSGHVVGWARNWSYRIDPRGGGSREDFGWAPEVALDSGSTAVMYRPGKVLIAGGHNFRAVRADIDGPFPAYESVPDLDSWRLWSTATVLPSGQVLLANGGDSDTSVEGAPLGNPARHVSLYDPIANTWTRGPSSQRARLYHSTAILLPDATVLLGGGGSPGPVTNLNAEIYYPPYLYAADGSLARRPSILQAPAVVDPQASFELTIALDDGIGKVVLVKTGGVTHSFDMDQRYVELAFTRRGDAVKASLPSHPADTPPGFYHVFVLDDHGVPSVSRIMRVTEYTGALPPVPARGEASAMVGSYVGKEHELACASGEVLVGIHGQADDRVRSAGPICVGTDPSTGMWSGVPTPRPVAGPFADGIAAPFVVRCPSNHAVTGFAGSADTDAVSGLRLACTPLSGPIAVAGVATELATLGAGPYDPVGACPSGKPASGVRADTRFNGYEAMPLVRFGLRCAG
ncbi:MAG: galactose oxidase-like domain-containing protein [Lautropia sp.]